MNHEHGRDIAKCILANGTVLGFVTLAQAELWMRLGLLALTIAYTARKLWLSFKPNPPAED